MNILTIGEDTCFSYKINEKTVNHIERMTILYGIMINFKNVVYHILIYYTYI